MWAYYYLAEKNLQAIEDSIPKLSHKIEKERARADEAQAKTEEQVQLAQQTILLHKAGKADCDDALVAIALKNMRLKKKVKTAWRTAKIVGGAGIILGYLLRGSFN